MEFYFIFTVILALISIFTKQKSLIPLVVCCVGFLMVLPSTGFDYDYYKEAFDSSYIKDDFPWFFTRSSLTAESGYIRYQGFFGSLFNFGFPVFLALNFLICFFLTYLTFKRFKSSIFLVNFWLYFIPVIFPTIFYFSPRSSISFALVFYAFVLLSNKNVLYAILLFFLGTSIHSQYLFLSLVILITYFVINNKSIDNRSSVRKKIHLMTLLVFIVSFSITYFSNYIVFFLKFLPSSELAANKFNSYTTNERSGFRVTGILSIIVYPLIVSKIEHTFSKSQNQTIFFNNINLERLFIYLLYAIVFYGAAINLSFINDPHLAGRLSRFSEYIGMGLVLPSYLYYQRKGIFELILILFVLISPVIYNTLYYNVDWNF
jgi:hypothetical protein